MSPDVAILWKVVDILVIGLGGATLTFILRLSSQVAKYQSDATAWRELFQIELKTLTRQVNKLQAWADSLSPSVEHELDDNAAIKGALKAQDDRLHKIESILMIIGRRVGVPTESLRRRDSRTQTKTP